MKVNGAKIKTLRKEQNLTQEQLAKRAGTSKSHVCAIEAGRTQRPSYDMIQSLAWGLGTTIDLMLESENVSDVMVLSEDEVFIRNYRRMGPAKRRKIRRLAAVLDMPDD